MNKKTMTEEDALKRLSALCAKGEHCSGDVKEKMRKWEMDDDTIERVIARLTADRYIDDERYTRAFVADKLRYNRWGRKKIEQALWMKHVDRGVVQAILLEIDDEEYLDVLRPLLQSKRKSTKAASEYEMNGKLFRFAAGRGFSSDLIQRALSDIEKE